MINLKKCKWNEHKIHMLINLYNSERVAVPYEYEMFAEDKLPELLNYQAYIWGESKKNSKIRSLNEDENYKGTFYIREKSEEGYWYIQYNNLTRRDMSGYNSCIYSLEQFKDIMEDNYSKVEYFYEIKGHIKKTKVYMFAPEDNLCVISNNYNLEDILNLLTIKGINLLVIPNFGIDESFKTNSNLAVSIYMSEKSRKMLLEYIDDINGKVNKVKKDLKNVREIIKNKCNPIDIDNDDDFTLFKSKHGNKLDKLLTLTTMSIKSYTALFQFAEHLEEFKILASVSVEFSNLLASSAIYAKIGDKSKKFIDNNNEVLEKCISAISSGTKYSVRLSDSKYIEKEFNKDIILASKWAEKYLDKSRVYGKKDNNNITYNPNNHHHAAIKKVVESLSKIGSISKIALFGSVAKGEENEESDIDIAIEMFYDTNNFTKARQRSIAEESEYALDDLNINYEEILPGFKRSDREIVFRFNKPIHLINLNLQKKKDLKAYIKGGFFDDSILLLKRDSFEKVVDGQKITIPYDLISQVAVSYEHAHTYGIIKIFSDEKKALYMFIPFDDRNDNEIECKYICKTNPIKKEYVGYKYVGCEDTDYEYVLIKGLFFKPSFSAIDQYIKNKDSSVLEREVFSNSKEMRDSIYYENWQRPYLNLENIYRVNSYDGILDSSKKVEGFTIKQY